MKRILLVLLLAGSSAVAQTATDSVAVDTTKVWTTKGNFSLLLNQSSFSNWIAGGENNISGTVGVNYDFNYKKDDWTWDNKVLASYGLVRVKNSSFEKKTDDRLEFNSLVGKQASGHWSYSFFLNFRTQFTKGYEYSKDEFGKEIRTENTNIFSPAYLSFGPGMLYKPSDNFKVNLSPAAAKLTFVDKYYTTIPGYVDGAYFGVDQGESMRFELGANANVYYKFVLMANVSVENILNLYSNYLEDPQNVDLDYQLNIVLKVNKWLTTNLNFQTIYDDNAFKGFQVRQVFGLAVNYGF